MKKAAALLILCLGCSDNSVTPVKDASIDKSQGDLSDVKKTDLNDADMSTLDPFAKTPTQPGVDPDGNSDLDSPLDKNEARVGKTPNGGSFHGVFAHCKPGDYILKNNLAEFCVQGVETNRFEFFHGGALVDMRRIGDTKEDVFDIWLPRHNLSVLDAQKVYVVNDGSKGGAAVLRVDGIDAAMAQIVGAVGPNLARPLGLDISVEYRLSPDSAHLEILTWTSTTDGEKQTIPVGEALGFGDRVKQWSESAGFNLAGVSELSALFAQGEGHSFAWYRDQPSVLFGALLDVVPWVLMEDRKIVIEGEQEHVTRRYLIVGDGSTISLKKEIRKIRKEDASNEVSLVLKYEDGTPAPNRLVEIYKGEAHVAFATSDASGAFSYLEADSTHALIEPLFGEDQHRIELEDSKTEYAIATPATLDIRGNDSQGRVTTSITIFKDGKKKSYVVGSAASFPIKVGAGDYQIFGDHGMEWDIAEDSTTLVAGDSKQVDLLLERVLDTTNYVAADFHQHMEPSIDSEVSVRDRILDNVAQGIEFVTPSDHEAVTDLAPYIVELGLEEEIGTVSGIEISPAHAHMNWFPMDYKPEQRGRGAIPLSVQVDGKATQRSFPEMIELGRLLPTDPIIQLNHGRGGSGYFNAVDFDPYTSTAHKPEEFTNDFDSMEVVNDEDEICILIEDWSAFLNTGYRPTAIGNSDSHGLWRQVGQNRNYIASLTDSPKEIDPQAIKQSVLQNQTIISRYALLDFPDALPGDTISTDTNTPVDLRIRVQTPPYSQVDRIMVLANGKIIDRIDLSSSADEIIDFDGNYSRTFTEDTWITFIALGPDVSHVINNGQLVFSMPNPIFIDVDGDVDNNGNMFEPVGAGTEGNPKIDVSLLLAEMPVCSATRE